MAKEMMQYTPKVNFAFVTRGTLANGMPSKACVHSDCWIRQQPQDDPLHSIYYWGIDTIGQNPLIYHRQHWLDKADYFKSSILKLLEIHFSLSIHRDIKRKRLQAPLQTVVQEFDSAKHRREVFTFPNPIAWKSDDVEPLFHALMNMIATH